LSGIRLLLDENVPAAIETALHRRTAVADVLRVGRADAPPKGTTDPDLLIWCEGADAILVTLDRRTMPEHLGVHLAAGRHSPGVFLINRRARLAEVIEDLLLILEASDPREWHDRVVTVPLLH